MSRLVFIDTETTSLRPKRRAWEVGLIVRDDDGDHEHHWFIDTAHLDLGNADPFALKVGGFYERHPQMVDPRNMVAAEWTMLEQVERLTRGALLVGAVPNFDAEVLAARMRYHDIAPSWHYHLIDVETLAAGALTIPPPWDFDKVLNAYGLTYDDAERHTALGDARMARDLYDAVMGEAAT